MTVLPPRRALIPMIIACALFMENLDSTVIATALPSIARSLGENPLRLNLAITSYLLSLAVFIPLSGWMADHFGARTVFRAAIVVFTVGSVCCALVDTLPELVLARDAAGARRRHDDAGRAAGHSAHRAQGRAGQRHGLSHHPGAARPGVRPAARRLHRHLLVLALDLPDQRADRRARHGAGDLVRRATPARPKSGSSTSPAS